MSITMHESQSSNVQNVIEEKIVGTFYKKILIACLRAYVHICVYIYIYIYIHTQGVLKLPDFFLRMDSLEYFKMKIPKCLFTYNSF